jgi:RNA polymerase sigma factor (TIGR02999 family)
MRADSADATALLLAWDHEGEDARSRLIELLYGELRRIAQRSLRRERPDHSLTPTALVHEAYLKLIDQRRVHWQNRAHFFAVAARLMRRILVDHARARGTAKRGGGSKVALEEADAATAPLDADLLALDAAIEKLGRLDPDQSRLVELRFFGGLTVDETAAVLGVAPITVKRRWALARAWLFRELRQAP